MARALTKCRVRVDGPPKENRSPGCHCRLLLPVMVTVTVMAMVMVTGRTLSPFDRCLFLLLFVNTQARDFYIHTDTVAHGKSKKRPV